MYGLPGGTAINYFQASLMPHMNIFLRITAIASALLLAAAISHAAHPSRDEGYPSLISKTVPYPEEYARPAEHRGQLRTLTYSTADYVSGSLSPRINSASIYLPYGYDSGSDRRYDILYLVHGHWDSYWTYFAYGNGLLVNVLDNMIERGDIKPMIVVTPTYNYDEPTAHFVDAYPYCEAMSQEMLNDLMPLIESNYRTYAATADNAGIEASRCHRAFGGFSMGSATTWYAFVHLLPYIHDYIPMSLDCWSLGVFGGRDHPAETAAFLARTATDFGYAGHGFYIWGASGNDDSAYNEIRIQMEAMANIPEVFNPLTFSFHEKDHARHEYTPTIEYLYNALLYLFPGEGATGSSAPGITAPPCDSEEPDYSVTGRRMRADEKGWHIRHGAKTLVR